MFACTGGFCRVNQATPCCFSPMATPAISLTESTIWVHFQRIGLTVFIFDYRGYGQSDGQITEVGSYSDMRGAIAWAKKKGWTPRQMIYFGRSLGSGGGPATGLGRTASRPRAGIGLHLGGPHGLAPPAPYLCPVWLVGYLLALQQPGERSVSCNALFLCFRENATASCRRRWPTSSSPGPLSQRLYT